MSYINDLKIIHVAKRQLGIDEDTYRDMLVNITGQNSLKNMHISDRIKIINHLKKIGFKIKPKAKPKTAKVTDQRAKIKAIWGSMEKEGLIKNGSKFALNQWVKRMSGVATVEWLSDIKQAQNVLESLKKYQQRLKNSESII